jgi:hypothetical protein
MQLKLQKLLLRRPQARNSSVGRTSTANGLDVVVVVVVADFEFRLGRARWEKMVLWNMHVGSK